MDWAGPLCASAASTGPTQGFPKLRPDWPLGITGGQAFLDLSIDNPEPPFPSPQELLLSLFPFLFLFLTFWHISGPILKESGFVFRVSLIHARRIKPSPCLDFEALLEGFDAAPHARHVALSGWLYRWDKGFGHALGMDARPEAIRLSNSGIREEIEVGREVTSRGSS